MNYPVWINADIIAGPLNSTESTPVNATRFLNGCKLLTSSTLSIGWTTRWGSDFDEGSYNDTQIDNMIDAIEVNHNVLTYLSIFDEKQLYLDWAKEVSLSVKIKVIDRRSKTKLTMKRTMAYLRH